jgi:CDP-glycerol glycerophosphotransferase
VGPPIDPAYDSGEGQDALERRYATRPVGVEDAVFFESFYGRNASCNPLAIDRELHRRLPALTRYWSVVDLSVPVPEGAVPVVEGSPEWWRARGQARLLVINDWLRRRFERRPGQIVLQTWHGTPLKRLALHRPGFDPRRALAVVRESRRWNLLLAQNPYAENILRKAYAFLTRPIWVEGYPRNDVLTTGDGAATRATLGIGPDERVLLYAPTWRDDRTEMVDFVDPVALATAADAVVLVRGHSRTLQPGRDAAGPRVVDVTGFPDTSLLLLAADALITDYSSVMFDFSVTGKPMYFLVPDMEHYRGQLRGFYFDLAAHAPGPVVRSQDELVEALRVADPAPYAAKYAQWKAKFNARDDGHAAERVVTRLLDQGFVTSPSPPVE